MRKLNGFTLVELIVVVVIISIAAVLAVPMLSSASSLQVKSAATMVAADLEYAKNMAISRQQNYAVIFDVTNSSYQIQAETSPGTWEVVTHPITPSKSFVIDFAAESHVDSVTISSVDFNSNQTITFDYLGAPYSGQSTGAGLNGSGQISLQADSYSMTINVEPITGYVTIQ
jgi:prepilin-type N-terminal cleavage/methylation domain-containing protein